MVEQIISMIRLNTQLLMEHMKITQQKRMVEQTSSAIMFPVILK